LAFFGNVVAWRERFSMLPRQVKLATWPTCNWLRIFVVVINIFGLGN